MRLPDASAPWYLEVTPGSTLPWLIALRWITSAVSVAAVILAWSFSGLDMPLRQLTVFIAFAAAANAAAGVLLSRGRAIPKWLAALALVVEMILLTGLLELTGGPFNPFGLLLAVQVALAALTLGQLYAALAGIVASLCYGTLIYWHVREVGGLHHRLNDLPTHLLTMWMAIATAGQLVGYFVIQASSALARREQELEALRQRAARTERLVSLTTLAAGAAHELSTPLATIAIASHELERAMRLRGVSPDLADDAHLIRTEVERCHAILDQMSGRAGGSASDDPEALSLEALMGDVRSRLSAHEAARLQVTVDGGDYPVVVPRAGLIQAVLALARNALDASESDGSPVHVGVANREGRLSITVCDRGHGIAPEVRERAGEPFFTTKEPGRGRGLGLFLTRVFAERAGGSLTLDSGEGTTARLDLPLPARTAESL